MLPACPRICLAKPIAQLGIILGRIGPECSFMPTGKLGCWDLDRLEALSHVHVAKSADFDVDAGREVGVTGQAGYAGQAGGRD